MQGTRVRSLLQEDPTCCEAANPVGHSYWASGSETMSPNSSAQQQKKPLQCEAGTPQDVPARCN